MTQFDEFFGMEFGPLCYATAATFTVAYIQALVCLKKLSNLRSPILKCMMIFIPREEKILDFSPAKNCTLNLETSILYAFGILTRTNRRTIHLSQKGISNFKIN